MLFYNPDHRRQAKARRSCKHGPLPTALDAFTEGAIPHAAVIPIARDQITGDQITVLYYWAAGAGAQAGRHFSCNERAGTTYRRSFRF